MGLSDFIRSNHDAIIDLFEAFARTMMPPGANMIPSQLRDHAEEMLTALVEDMDTAQTPDQQSEKSRGMGGLRAMAASGHLHADARIRHGFTPAQLLAEFRALRASVLRLYEDSGDADLGGVRRFNEGIDEVLTESMTRYAALTDLYRDQLVGVLGHDLRNPLHAISTGGALLMASADTDQRQARIAATILRSAQRMQRMINDLSDLTLVRLGGSIPLRRVPADLRRICEDAVLEIQAAHPSAEVRYASDGDLAGEWDEDRLAQVLSNLLGNAIQHGDGRSVTLAAKGEGAAVVVTVHNLGVPIPAELQGAIFQPLVSRSSRSPAEHGSIGLGLFIAHAIVSSHEGNLDVTSSEEEGTTFTVRLPRRPAVTRDRHELGSTRI